jgi:hypothetical protein
MTSALRFSPLCLMFFATCAVASDPAEISQREETLCNKGEDIYFSCPLENEKIISICASNNTASDRGYVKYRYGDKADAFVYPENDTPPGDRFVISDVSEGSIRGLHLKFVNGRYAYVISSVWPGGIYVSKNGKIIFDQECQASGYKSFSNKIFDGVKQVPPSDVDIH